MSVDTKYGEAIFKQTQEVAEMFKAAMPKITTNKNDRAVRQDGSAITLKCYVFNTICDCKLNITPIQLLVQLIPVLITLLSCQ